MRRCARLALAAAVFLAACSHSTEPPPLQGARIGGPFVLVDQNGRSFSDRALAGRYRIIYFGYSFCPDVCPTDLQTVGQALTKFEKAAPDRAKRVQPVFITVDPQRDTADVLKKYVAAFHPRLIGLTGPAPQIVQVEKEFGIYASPRPASNGIYFVDHSRQAVLFGPNGEPILLLPVDQGAKAVKDALDQWVK